MIRTKIAASNDNIKRFSYQAVSSGGNLNVAYETVTKGPSQLCYFLRAHNVPICLKINKRFGGDRKCFFLINTWGKG